MQKIDCHDCRDSLISLLFINVNFEVQQLQKLYNTCLGYHFEGHLDDLE